MSLRIRRRGPVSVTYCLCAALTGFVLSGAASSPFGGIQRSKEVRGAPRPIRIIPRPHSRSVIVDTTISVRFDRTMDVSSFELGKTFKAFGLHSGAVTGNLEFSLGQRKVTLIPDHPLAAGEEVVVVLSHDIRGQDGVRIRDSGYTFQFWTKAGGGEMLFENVGTLTTRSSPSVPTTAYGGHATNFTGDRYPDLAIVHEASSDVRVFVNNGTFPGLFGVNFLSPPVPVGDHASPSQPSDFNGDGKADLAVANTIGNSISIMIGRGDGTFDPPQVVPVGVRPRGIAVLDVDGDGDIDIANTNNLSHVVSILLNDGLGTFANPYSIDPGESWPWGLATADMNSDGLFDLVVGTQGNERIVVMACNGDGTFTVLSNQPAGGTVWMLNCGDVNGDGFEDVSVATGADNTGVMLFGNGQGGLGPPQVYQADPFVTSSKLGDLNGDGYLDWVLSGFFGDWTVYMNDGSGGFVFSQKIPSPSAASCSIPVDLDLDGDLDLAMIDEVADAVVLMENRQTGSVPCSAVTDFSYVCKNGRVDVTIALADGTYNGKHISIRLGNRVYPVTVVGSYAELGVRWLPSMDSASLEDPAGCIVPFDLVCQ